MSKSITKFLPELLWIIRELDTARVNDKQVENFKQFSFEPLQFQTFVCLHAIL